MSLHATAVGGGAQRGPAVGRVALRDPLCAVRLHRARVPTARRDGRDGDEARPHVALPVAVVAEAASVASACTAHVAQYVSLDPRCGG